jgi:hypothetical protein
VKQPWAWLICEGPKDIENRNWRHAPRFRGRVLIAASAHRPSRNKWTEIAAFAEERGATIPPREQLVCGGIIGEGTLVDCVTEHSSPWFEGRLGLVLDHRRPLPFLPIVGQLGLYTPPPDVLARL